MKIGDAKILDLATARERAREALAIRDGAAGTLLVQLVLLARDSLINDYLFPSGLYPVIALAFVGLAVSILLRIRTGWWLGILSFVLAVGLW